MSKSQNNDIGTMMTARTQKNGSKPDQTVYALKHDEPGRSLPSVVEVVTPDGKRIDWNVALQIKSRELLLLVSFIGASRAHEHGLRKQTFARDLNWCLREFGNSTVRPDLVSGLYDQAVLDRQHLLAFDSYLESLQSSDFKSILQFVRAERTRIAKILRLLNSQEKNHVPDRLTQWNSEWFGGLRELVCTMNSNLLLAEETLREQQAWLRSGRIQFVSHLLANSSYRIKKLVAERYSSKIGFGELVVAYAHAARLFFYTASRTNGNPVDAMKMRISRAKRSRSRSNILFMMHLQSLNALNKQLEQNLALKI